MLCEAVGSGSFGRYTVAEVDQRLVDAVRANGNAVTINVAAADGIQAKRLSGIRLCNPRVRGRPGRADCGHSGVRGNGHRRSERHHLLSGRCASIAAMIAEALRPGRQRIIYTAENDNYAAEKLEKEVVEAGRPARRVRPADPEHGDRQDERRDQLRRGNEGAGLVAARPRFRQVRPGGRVQQDPHLPREARRASFGASGFSRRRMTCFRSRKPSCTGTTRSMRCWAFWPG